jgi:hypothetical protein
MAKSALTAARRTRRKVAHNASVFALATFFGGRVFTLLGGDAEALGADSR